MTEMILKGFGAKMPTTNKNRILNHPVKKWGWREKSRYYAWVRETYGDADNPEKYTDNYRALKQLQWSMRSPLMREPTQILTSAGLVAEATKILNASLKEVYEKHDIL